MMLPIAVMAFSIVALLLLMDISMGIFRNGTVITKNTNTKNVNSQNTNAAKVVVNSNANVNDSLATNTNESASQVVDWKTYSNSSKGYSISYPPTWILNEALAPGVIQLIPPDAASKTSLERSPAVFITSDVQAISMEYGDRIVGSINGVQVVQVTGGAMYEEEATFFPVTSGYVTIRWPKAFASEYKDYVGILNSFKLTDPTVALRTYTNTVYQYELKYPGAWTAPLADATIAEFTVGVRQPFWIETVAAYDTPDYIAGTRTTVTINNHAAFQQTEGGESTYIVTYFPQMSGYRKVAYEQGLVGAPEALQSFTQQ